jgi:glycosyltransferase involved in cell wall biosynthesis
MKPLSILSVAYPFAAVSADAAGGAEQVLFALDRALCEAGHRSIVLAQSRSRVAGRLVAGRAVEGALTEEARAAVRREVRETIMRLLREEAIDLVHFHGIDFADYLPDANTPMLGTLHLPPAWFPASLFAQNRDKLWLNPVSASQAAACPPSRSLLPPIENGVPVDALQAVRITRRGYAMVLARICPEKGIHLAVEAAGLAGMSLLIAGDLFPYPEHERYFREEVAPRLDRRRRFIGPVGFARKRRLLAAARCLLVPSLVDETSSLVAREAIACGTPVIAFRRGALAETVEHGVTGFLVDGVEDMASAMARASELDPEAARRIARERFGVDGMARRYLGLYQELVDAGGRRRGAA